MVAECAGSATLAFTPGTFPGTCGSLLQENNQFNQINEPVHADLFSTAAPFLLTALLMVVAGWWLVTSHRRKVREAVVDATRDSQALLESAVRQTVGELRESLVVQQQAAITNLTESLERRHISTAAAAQAAASQQSQHELELIRSELAPLQQGLTRLTQHLTEARAGNSGDLAAIGTLLQRVTEEQRHHREDTRQLHRALRTSHVRGQYGELTLQRTLEHAGLLEHVHYLLQPTERDEAGSLRPDAIIKLPCRRSLVVDSKAPLDSLIALMGAKDKAEQQQHAQAHARLLRGHIEALARRDYPARLRSANGLIEGETMIEAALLFLPSQPALDVALRADESLLSFAFERKVFVVTPSTLLLALSTVSQLWQHDTLTKHAHEVLRLGIQLHGRIGTFADHMAKLGRALASAVDTYNAAVRSLDSRVLSTARRFAQLGAASGESTPTVKPLQQSVQPLGSGSDAQCSSVGSIPPNEPAKSDAA